MCERTEECVGGTYVLLRVDNVLAVFGEAVPAHGQITRLASKLTHFRMTRPVRAHRADLSLVVDLHHVVLGPRSSCSSWSPGALRSTSWGYILDQLEGQILQPVSEAFPPFTPCLTGITSPGKGRERERGAQVNIWLLHFF